MHSEYRPAATLRGIRDLHRRPRAAIAIVALAGCGLSGLATPAFAAGGGHHPAATTTTTTTSTTTTSATSSTPTSPAPVTSVTAEADNAGADVSWPAATTTPSYYLLEVTDATVAANSFAAQTHGAYTSTHVSDLTNGDHYSLAVLAEPGDVAMGATSFTPQAPTLTGPAAPSVDSVTPTVVNGAPAVTVHIAAPAQPVRYEAVAAFDSSWRMVAKSVAPVGTGGATITVGPLAANSTYNLGTAATTAAGQGGIAWNQVTTGAANCPTQACLTVTPTATRFKTTVNGILNSVPSTTMAGAFTGLHPAMYRVNTGYGGTVGAANLIAPTGGAIIENLADTWWYKTYTAAAGGAMPPWECWSCYSSFITSQVSAIEAAGTHPAYWEIENEPGHPGGSYPAHLQGNAALDLQQLSVAATAIRSVDPSARILAPTNGAFLIGTTNLDQPYLSLDALLANASQVPGLGGLDWHEIDANVVSPALAANDVAMARTVSSMYGLPTLAQVVSEYTTPRDASLAGGEGIWLGELSRAGVTYASRACWTDQPGLGTDITTCDNRLADGLFTLGGQLTAPGQVDQLYGNLAASGGNSATVDSSTPDIAATAAVGNDGTVRVLLGREVSCMPLLNAACPSSTTAASDAKTLTVKVPMATQPPATATIVTVPAGVGVVPTTTSTAPITWTKGVASVTVSAADGAATEVVL